ncbi:hypothetical protein CHLRE_17g746247v5 [Chlamydomonas reinhardtii]|uniref:Uncharacterized protein n=1 Tax=Chlamydomonas reinhardtii TaxID=3055 RepID=A0A2K3CS39_CHLRE|nr:uncharacterized protein CHLRE_17g746247v5 [Chlamydomonas reinhardtii]PNW71091.1 hypothetical protein CHLRE_17g746247v5 [Chlamydomonas reinhardtii]
MADRARGGSLEPPSHRNAGHNEEQGLQRGGAGRQRAPKEAAPAQAPPAPAAFQASPGNTVAELVKRYRSLKKEYLSRQREKAVSVLAANKASLDQFVAHRLASVGVGVGVGSASALPAAAPSLPIPKLGDVNTDPPGSYLPLLPPPEARPRNVLPLPLAERRVGVRLPGGGGSGAGGGGGAGAGGGSEKGQPSVRTHVRVLPPVQPPPGYTTWSYLKRNELARDHGRRMFLVDELGETVPADDGETEERLPWEDADGAAVDWAMSRLAEEAGWEDADMLEALMDALRPQPQPEAIAQRLAYLYRLTLTDDKREHMEVEEVLDAFVGSFCRRCRIYGCRTHSGGHVKPHQRPAPPPPDTSPTPCGPHCWKKQQQQQQQQQQGRGGGDRAAAGEEAGGGDAMDVDGGAGAAGAAAAGAEGPQGRGGSGSGGDGGGGGSGSGGEAWSVYEVSLVEQGIQVFGPGNPCMAALLLAPRRTCAQVKAAMDRVEAEAAEARRAAAAAAAAQAAAGRGGRAGEGAGGGGGGGGVLGPDGDLDLEALRASSMRRKGGGRAKKALLSSRGERSLVVAGRAAHGPADQWQDYQPCTCEGRCKADCPCVAARNFCEKFCACSAACKERFRGCTCKSGCKNNMCPCAAAGRECDPDLCAGCAPTLEGRAEPGRECANMRLRLRQHAHVVLGTSDIPGAGWGLFAAQYVARNGFLGEYTGDLITQDEANRRGSVYDHMNNRGNKLRCANHSSEPVAKAKVLLVDGESRIAIFADKPVTPGMEITYDYRYSEDTAPHWVNSKKKMRGG